MEMMIDLMLVNETTKKNNLRTEPEETLVTRRLKLDDDSAGQIDSQERSVSREQRSTVYP